MTGIVAAGGAVAVSGGMLPDPERAKPPVMGWLPPLAPVATGYRRAVRNGRRQALTTAPITALATGQAFTLGLRRASLPRSCLGPWIWSRWLAHPYPDRRLDPALTSPQGLVSKWLAFLGISAAP